MEKLTKNPSENRLAVQYSTGRKDLLGSSRIGSKALLIFTILTIWSVVPVLAEPDGGQDSAAGDPIAAWIARAPVDANLRAELTTSWNGVESATPSERLDRFAQIAARLDAHVARLSSLATEDWPQADFSGFTKELSNYPSAVANNLRLWFARRLVHASLYDEADEQLGLIEGDAVLDPASLHFYRAVGAYRAMDKARTTKSVKSLLAYNATEGVKVPERYLTVARLMSEDVASIEKESLDHIARQMEDIERRLDLSRSGKKVQDVEDAVIRSLDKLIEKIEKQQKKSSSGGNNLRPNNPASDSVKMGGKGPGRVAHKKIGTKDGWGNLPPKQREEAMQEVGRRFPAHYREVIEQYFRQMATEP